MWFDGLGWVPFEPTPGRGAPGAADYTGLAPQQEDDPIEFGDGGGTQEIPGPQVTVPPATLPGGGAVPTTFPDIAPTFADPVDGDSAATLSPDDESSPWRTVLLGILVALVLLAPAVARRIRRRSHRDPDVEIQRLWARATSAVASVGVDVRPNRTPTENAATTTRQFPTASRPMSALAEALDHAVYGTDGTAYLTGDGTYGTTMLGNCSVWCRQIEKAVVDSMTPVDRFKRYFTNWG